MQTTVRQVTPGIVGMIDGRSYSGKISGFSTTASDFIVEVGVPGGEPPQQKVHLEAERVAYIAFRRHGASDPTRPDIDQPVTLRVHVAGGESFTVIAAAADLDSVLGFRAHPADVASPFTELFFYSWGVNAKESTEPLGSMLVSGGLVKPVDLSRGVQHQSSERKLPIGQILVQKNTVTPEEVEQARQLQARRTLRIGEVLVEQGLATGEEIAAALSEQRHRRGKRLGQILIDMQIITEAALYQTLARKFHMPFVDLDEVQVNEEVVAQVGDDVMRKHRILPLDSDGARVVVAISDPLNTEIQDVLRFQLGKLVQEVLVVPSQLGRYLDGRLKKESGGSREMDIILRALEAESAQAEDAADEGEDNEPEPDSAVVRLANQIIIDGVRLGASDIHIEPNGKDQNTIVRFRVDGQCILYQAIPPVFRMPLVARLKIMANLDISERRKPQDGKIRIRVAGAMVELRVATIPTVNGNEDVVMRILAASKPIPLGEMGMSERNLSELERAISKPYGLVLCVGPTGSGKTTTLHSALGSINTVGRKIWTAEDPVEITQPGLRQVQVKPRIGFTFAAAMRAFLRADPDVIMIGEMRDEETAGIAVEASLTGHLVLSTLHTNSAPETITRLLDMGLDPFTFADALLGVMAQRLARALCKQCRKPYPASDLDYEEVATAYGPTAVKKHLGITSAEGLQLWSAAGCESCNQTGYKGRVAVHELLVTTDDIKAAIARRASVAEIRELAVAGGMTTLMQDGIEKAIAGKTDLRQVVAVCSR